MGRVILQHVYMYLSFNSMESVIDYQYLWRPIRVIKKFPFTRYPKILLKGNKEINLDISEPKH